MALKNQLKQFFELEDLNTTIRTEVVAGITTFLAMSYIIAVNPLILADAGIPPVAAAFATCLISGIGTIGMGLWARVPLALAPGMGLNAFLVYTVVQGTGMTWQEALGVVFLSGVVFALATAVGVRQAIARALPEGLLAAIGAGIGLFLVVIGFNNAGIIQSDAATLLTRGDMTEPAVILTLATVLVTATLLVRGIRSGILIGIGVATVAAILLGISDIGSMESDSRLETMFQLEFGGLLSIGILDVLLALVFVDFFDSLGTMVGVMKRAGLAEKIGGLSPRLGKMLGVDAAATMAGALAGTSTVTTYIESAAGITAGGRSGLTAVTTGVLFLLAIPIAPFVSVIPSSAVAAALIIIGTSMLGLVRDIDWDDMDTAVPALFMIAGMPLTFSIADGLAMGVIAYSALKILRGRALEAGWFVHILAALFVARYVALS